MSDGDEEKPATRDLDVHALRSRMHPPTLSTAPERVLPLENEVAPLASPRPTGVIVHGAVTAANELAKNLHPAFLVFGRVGIEVDDLAVIETDSEAFLDEHVALFLLGKS